jgi:hypothetical protein
MPPNYVRAWALLILANALMYAAWGIVLAFTTSSVEAKTAFYVTNAILLTSHVCVLCYRMGRTHDERIEKLERRLAELEKPAEISN